MIGTDGGTRTHMVSRTILSRVRLPIPPHRHKYLLNCISFLLNYINIYLIKSLVKPNKKCKFFYKIYSIPFTIICILEFKYPSI